MARISIENCIKHIPNRFELVVAVSKRTKHLNEGAKPLINPKKNTNPLIALKEIEAGFISTTFQKEV